MKGKASKKSKRSYGWRGKILWVDLSKSELREEELPQELRDKYIGGAGINARLLYNLMRAHPHLDPLAPENPLIFGFGVLVGTSFPCTSRFTVTAKSPLTRIFGDSNAGGFFPARVKQAGYDHIVIQGRAEKPVALLIEQGTKPMLVDATDLWTLDTYTTGEKINEKYGKCESARIGPAGENLVRYASILSGTKRVSCNGKTGMGCVMGSKNLKAVIVKADGKVPVAHKKKFDELAKRYLELWNGTPTASHKEYGSLVLIAQASNQTRIKNQQQRITPEQLEHYDIDRLVKTYKAGQTACYRCPIACTQKWQVSDGPYQGALSDKLEFGHYTNMGPLLGIFDFPALVHLSDQINRLGMDCIQFGWIVAMAMECFQRGILGTEQTGGIALNWGDVEVISDLMNKIAQREGLGNLLAESMPDILSKLGPEASPYGFHTKGLSFTYNCTQAIAMSLASSVATRGADHLKGHPFPAMIGLKDMLERIFGKDLPEEITDHASPVAKGRVVWWSENYKMLMDSLGLCFIPVVASDLFGDPLILFEEMGEIYQAATGCDPGTLFESTERSYQIEKCFNALLGITRKDDIRHGTRRGEQDPIHHPGMLDEYYTYRGCSKDGLPTYKRLEEIGLSDVADDLTRQGKIGDSECPAISELLSNAV
jgi:aldehyde:ferredoxin oxidoreductase